MCVCVCVAGFFKGCFCFQRQPFGFSFYITAAGVKCRVADVKRLPVLYHSADCIFITFIFITFGITEPNLVSLKSEHRLS